MSLIDHMMTDCCFMKKAHTPDGAGGFIATWSDGAVFKAAITLNTTIEAQLAEQQGVSSVYTITTSQNTVLNFHDVVKRISDGRYFRVTSNQFDKLTPIISCLDIAQVTAEGWELS